MHVLVVSWAHLVVSLAPLVDGVLVEKLLVSFGTVQVFEVLGLILLGMRFLVTKASLWRNGCIQLI